MKRIFLVIVLVVSIISLFSCNGEVIVSVNADDSGTIDLALKLDPMLTQYIFDLQSSFTNSPPEEGQSLFNPAQIREGLKDSKTVSVIDVTSANANELKMKLAFEPLTAVLGEGDAEIDADTQKGIREIMDLTISSDGTKKMFFKLDKEKFNNLIEMLPDDIRPMIAPLGPPGYDVEPEEYLEVLKLNFIEYDPEYIGKQIRKAKLILKLNVDGKIISHEGGVRKGNMITYEIPLLDLLLMAEPIYFDVQFK